MTSTQYDVGEKLLTIPGWAESEDPSGGFADFAAAEPTPAPRPLDLLRQVFGYDSFRGRQEEVIEHVVAGGDALVLMPTGGGKSLCYQIPALVRPGLGIVVSPLIALMRDQVAALRQAGVRAAYLNSSQEPAEARRVEAEIRAGALDILYVAPERLVLPYFLDFLGSLKLSLFAIDEAHCVSQWGHNFRPEYRQLSVLYERFPTVPRVALTATADGPTRKDIVERLRLEDARIFVSSFDRPNIAYRLVDKTEARAQLRRFIQTHHPGDAGIVYCLSRRKVDEVAAWLTAEGVPALAYHAGLDAETRTRHQDRFLKEDGIVMVATVAFGMGIDKPDIRFVAHLDAPRSLEAYYQETGRAGRDGLPADAWMAYGLADVVALRQMVQGSDLPERQKRVEAQKLDALLGFCETAGCRRRVLLHYFGEDPGPGAFGPGNEQEGETRGGATRSGCGNCDNCLEPVAREDGTVEAQMALSAVFRTGQRFGAQHLIDVLTGHKTERVKTLGHDGLKTFGVGKSTSRGKWQSILRQLVAAGYLSVDIEGHGGLILGGRAEAVLKGRETVEFRLDRAAETRRDLERAVSRGAPQRGEPGPAHAATMREDPLFARLRQLRLELAKAQGVPPFVIFHDTTLVAMVERRPQNLAELAAIPGVGKSKLERYGAKFCQAIAGDAVS